MTYDVARYLEGKSDSLKASGSIAFVVIKTDQSGKPVALFFARNYSSPLKMQKNDASITLSSEGEGVDVEPERLYCMNYDTGEITTRKCMFPSSYRPYTGPNRSTAQTPAIAATSHFSRTTHSEYPNPNRITLDPERESVIEETETDGYVRVQTRLARHDLLKDCDWDPGNAVKLGEAQLDTLIQENSALDIRSQDPEAQIKITDEEVAQYVQNEDVITFLEGAIKELKEMVTAIPVKQVIDAKVKEERGKSQQGFHFTPLHLRKETI